MVILGGPGVGLTVGTGVGVGVGVGAAVGTGVGVGCAVGSVVTCAVGVGSALFDGKLAREGRYDEMRDRAARFLAMARERKL